MTTIADVVAITVNVGDLRLTAAGFGVPLLVVNAENTVFTPRVKSYVSAAAVAVDFATTTKPYKMANAIFSQPNSPPTVKIGRQEIGDADLTAALTAIEVEDAAWYALATESVSDADITLAVAFIESRAKIYAYASEEEDIIATGSADIASVFKAATRNRSFGIWQHHAGRDEQGTATSTLTANIATITTTMPHFLEVGDPVTISAAVDTDLDGEHVIATVPSATTFTIAIVAADDVGPSDLDYFAGFVYPNCAWLGLQLATNPGSTTWKFKQLSGIAASDLIALTAAEEAFALGKNINIYTFLGSTGVGFTHEGVMASGRFIDVQRGIDFMEARMGEAIATLLLNTPKIPYTDAGMAVIEATIQQQMNSYIGLGILAPLLNTDDGALFRIVIPKVSTQLTADRSARVVKNISVVGQLAGAVHKVEITLNAQV